MMSKPSALLLTLSRRFSSLSHIRQHTSYANRKSCSLPTDKSSTSRIFSSTPTYTPLQRSVTLPITTRRKATLLPLPKQKPRTLFSSFSSATTLGTIAPVTALVFDTETTDKVNFNDKPTSPGQPDLVQLAFLLIDTSTWITRSKASLIVRLRDGVSIQPGAQSIHGISAEDCSKYGVEADTAAAVFADACRRADVLVAHNAKFDVAVMQAALYRATPSLEIHLEQLCTMQQSTEVCRVPARYGDGYKWPSLSEAYSFVTGGEELVGCHDAMVDAEACAKIFRYLVEEGHVDLEKFASSEKEGGESSYREVLQECVETVTLASAQPYFGERQSVKRKPVFIVRGNTYAHKEKLKELGGKWNIVSKEWEFYGPEHRPILELYADLKIF